MNLTLVIFVVGLIVKVRAETGLTSTDPYPDDKFPRIIGHAGKNFTIYCVMDLDEFLGYNSSNMAIFFNPNIPLEKVLPSFNLEIFNETTVVLQIYNPPKIKEVLNCVVRQNNSVTHSVDMLSLEIGTPPEKVEDFGCRTYNWDKMVCHFTPPFNYLFPDYALFVGLNKLNVINISNRKVGSNTDYIYTLSYETSSYNPSKEWYHFTLRAKNVLGELIQNFVVNNYKTCISDPPEKLRIVRIGKYDALIYWQVPSIMKRSQTYITHKIMYSFNNSSFIEYMNFSSHENDNNRIALNVPLANTLYEVRVYIKVTAAPNTDEFWSYSKRTFSTLPDRPSKPPTVTAGSFYRKVDSNDLIVYWKEVENIYKNGQGYNVSIVNRDGNNVKIIHMTNTMATIPYVDDMTYKLYSENVIGKLETYSEIFVPSNQLPKITDIKSIIMDNTYRLSWSYNVPNNFNEDIENFTVFWCTAKSAAIDKCATSIDFKILDNSTMNFTHPSLLNATQYNFAVAVNTKTTSSGMTWAQCTADPNTSLGKLRAFYISSVSSNSIVVKWHLDCIYETIVTGFNLKYCKLRDPKDASCDGDAMLHSISGTASEYKIGNLLSYTSYSISIQLYSNKQIVSFSDPKVNTTLESEPSVPRNLRYSNLTYNSTHLEWDAPLYKNGRLDHYVIWYKAKSEKVQQKEIRIEESSSLSYVLSNLNSYMTYEIWVTACTRYCSNSSNLITITTKIGPPMKVLDVITERGRNNSQILSWKQAKPTGPHEIYDVIVRATVRDTKFEYIASIVKETQCTIKIHSIYKEEDISYHFYVKPKNIIYKFDNEYLQYETDIINELMFRGQILLNNSRTNIDVYKTTTHSNQIPEKVIVKRHILMDRNSTNQSRRNAIRRSKQGTKILNINNDISKDKNHIYCLEGMHDINNFYVVYVGEAVEFPKLIKKLKGVMSWQ